MKGRENDVRVLCAGGREKEGQCERRCTGVCCVQGGGRRKGKENAVRVLCAGGREGRAERTLYVCCVQGQSRDQQDSLNRTRPLSAATR